MTNGEVEFCREAAHEYFHRYTDAHGIIHCSLLTNHRFNVIAGRLQWDNESDPVADGESMVAEPGDTMLRLKFVISKTNDKRDTLAPSSMSDFNKPCV